MKISDLLQNEIVIFDGGMGTMLQRAGLRPGELPEYWNITHPEVVESIHRAYYEAGASVVSTNTFGAYRTKFGDDLDKIITAAVENAKRTAADEKGRFVALSLGPIGRLLQPFGDLPFEEAVSIFAESVRCGAAAGADLILFETMNDAYESKAAVLAAKENCDLPIILTNVYDERGKLMTGAEPEAMVALLEGLGVSALGVNCSLGPRQMRGVVERLCAAASIPVLVNPNAGLPRSENGSVVYDVDAVEFAAEAAELVRLGAHGIGGCCGTTPDYIHALGAAVADITPMGITQKNTTLVSSYTHAVDISVRPALIGERINPTGKKAFKEALRNHDVAYILNEAVQQEKRGADILDVNVGLPGIDEAAVMAEAVTEIQTVTDLPLQIDSSDPAVLERAMRLYNGKPMVNSVNGKAASMEAVFPLVKKYGGVVVALTLDENGIPDTARGRLEIARNIMNRAAEYGIEKKNIVVDPLTMAVSASPDAALVTLEAVSLIRNELGLHTSLGVSNVSFGLPARDDLNAAMFTMALQRGLSAAIMNPYSEEMLRAYHSYLALTMGDTRFERYIAFASGRESAAPTARAEGTLGDAISRGMKESAAALTEQLLAENDPMEIINGHIIPALDAVGRGFEAKKIYLPQLLMSAEAATASFAVIKSRMGNAQRGGRGCVLLATVKGDIHDIGKNIVKVLLENYGFDVLDLGRDVSPQKVLETIAEKNIRLVGLSSLMTTTVPAMEETIALLREKAPETTVMVGGAVLTADYAAEIGAHFYARDAMEGVRYAERVFG